MPQAAKPADLSVFQRELIGTWTNQNLPGVGRGGPDTPYSYNVMVLPQESPQSAKQDLGYILKNFTYYEKIKFHGDEAIATHGSALNRGSDYSQNPFVLFYDQQVRFAEGPDKDEVIHLENGAWLHLQTQKQMIGPYPYPPDDPALEPGDPVPQPADMTLAKQIAIPHGVSVLALGCFSVEDGSPTIPDGPNVLPPEELGQYPYDTVLDRPDDYQNPHPELALNIHAPLQQAVGDLAECGNPVTNYIHCQVDTSPNGHVMSIPFEEAKARLDSYAAEYWMLSLDGGSNYNIFAYSQKIVLKILVRGTYYLFARPTANVVTRILPQTGAEQPPA